MTTLSPNDERFGFKAQGKFRCAWKYEIPLLIGVYALTIAGILTVWSNGPIMRKLLGSWGSGMAAPFRFLVTVAFLIVWISFMFAAAKVVIRGREYYYEADDNEFRVYRIAGKDEKILLDTIYYVDVMEVTYQDTLVHPGYNVIIRTRYREYRYIYVIPRSQMFRSTEYTPFFIIEERAGLRESRVYL